MSARTRYPAHHSRTMQKHIGLHLVGHPDAVPLPKTHLSALDKIERPL